MLTEAQRQRGDKLLCIAKDGREADPATPAMGPKAVRCSFPKQTPQRSGLSRLRKVAGRAERCRSDRRTTGAAGLA